MAYMFERDSIWDGIDSILGELKKHYLVERFYTSALFQHIFLDKDGVFSSFPMVNFSQNMEYESNPCLISN
jgi:hypothetical protein